VIKGEEKELVGGALKRNQSPASMVFQLAQSRGFQLKTAEQIAAATADAGGEGAGKTNGTAPAGGRIPGNLADAAASAGNGAATQNGKGRSVTEEVAALRRGQQAAASLSDAGAGGTPTALTAQKVAAMSDAEFEKFIEGFAPDDPRLKEWFGA
jgi:hypothetical protein